MSMTTREELRKVAEEHGWTLKIVSTPNGMGKDTFSIGSTVFQGRVWSPPAHQIEVGFSQSGGVAWASHNLDEVEGKNKKGQVIATLAMWGKKH